MLIDELIKQIKDDPSRTEEYKLNAFNLLENYKRLGKLEQESSCIVDVIVKFFMQGNFELNTMTYLLGLHIKNNNNDSPVKIIHAIMGGDKCTNPDHHHEDDNKETSKH